MDTTIKEDIRFEEYWSGKMQENNLPGIFNQTLKDMAKDAWVKGSSIIAAEAYQIIGSLAEHTNVFETTGVDKALNYFGDVANEGFSHRCDSDILPWDINSV